MRGARRAGQGCQRARSGGKESGICLAGKSLELHNELGRSESVAVCNAFRARHTRSSGPGRLICLEFPEGLSAVGCRPRMAHALLVRWRGDDHVSSQGTQRRATCLEETAQDLSGRGPDRAGAEAGEEAAEAEEAEEGVEGVRWEVRGPGPGRAGSAYARPAAPPRRIRRAFLVLTNPVRSAAPRWSANRAFACSVRLDFSPQVRSKSRRKKNRGSKMLENMAVLESPPRVRPLVAVRLR